MNEPNTAFRKLSEELKYLRNKLAVLESTLIQRHEEIEQTRAEAAELRSELARLQSKREDSESRLKEADAWVFKLAEQRQRLESDVQSLTRSLAKLEKISRTEIKQLASTLELVEAERKDLTGVAAQLRSQLTTLERDLVNAHAATAELRRSGEAKLSDALSKVREVQSEAEQKIAERFSEIAKLTSLLAEQSASNAHKELDNAWLRDIVMASARMPKWWMFLPESWHRKRRHAFYIRAGLFDAATYLATYPDVAENGMDAVRHYILHGMAEGRERTLP